MKKRENSQSLLSWKSNGDYLQEGVSEQMCNVAKSFLKAKNSLIWQCGNHW